MTKSNKFIALTLTTVISTFAIGTAANAEDMVKVENKVTLAGDAVIVTETSDVNKAADSMKITRTTYSYDANNNGVIEPNEFNTYLTRTVDTNNDGYIVLDEFEGDSMTYYYNYNKPVVVAEGNAKASTEVKSYTYWDKDKDDRLDSDEVESLVANMGLYKKWDTNLNGTIETSEFSAGTFTAYDTDKNGSISMEEWNAVVM